MASCLPFEADSKIKLSSLSIRLSITATIVTSIWESICVHCTVDCTVLWPKLYLFFEVVGDLGMQGGVLVTKLESMLGVDLLTKILSVGCDDLPKELTGRFWSAVADLLSCRVQDDDEEDMSGQVMVSQAAPGTLASDNGSDNTDSQVVLGVANVHEDAVLL